MSKGTLIYVGGFILPDKNAAANRVVSNGKLFNLLGYRTVFLGAAQYDEHFVGVRKVAGSEDMYEQAHPSTSAEWVKHMFSIEHINSLVERYGDVKAVILYNSPLLTLIRARQFFRKKNIEIYYDCTEWTADTDGSFLKRAFKTADEFFVRNFAHKIADKMIVISSMMQKKYRKNKALLLLPPLVDINDGIWHQCPEKHDGIFEFCFAGVPDGNKDSLDKVVQAFDILDNSATRLKIAGVSQEDFERLYPQCTVSDKARRRIVFMGRLSHSQAVKCVLGCDCYIFIRESDRRNNAGFPTKFAEAFTCGVPVLTTDVSDIKKYLSHGGKGCLIKEVSPQAIACAMQNQLNTQNSEIKRELNSSFHYGTFSKVCKEWLEK